MSEEELDEEMDGYDDDDDEDEEANELPNFYAQPGAILDPRYRTKSGRFAKGHKGRKHDPRRRTRRHRAKDPRKRHYRKHDPRVRRHGGRRLVFKRRMFDIAGMSPFWSAILTPVATAIGSLGHNYLYNTGMAKGTLTIPYTNGANITSAGFGGGLASVLLGYFGRGSLTSLLAHVGAGAFAEGLNVPAIDGITRTGAGAATMGGGVGAPKVGGLVVGEYMNSGPMGLRY